MHQLTYICMQVLREMSDLSMEQCQRKEGWNFVITMSGVLSVMIFGDPMMQL